MRLWLLILSVAINYLSAAETLVKYPDVEIDLAKQELRIDATVSEELLWGEPALEFVLMRGTIKAYETLLLTNAEPAIIQLGLLMLTMQPLNVPIENNIADAKTSFFTIFISYQDADGEKIVALEDLLISRRTNEKPQPMIFAFDGSYYYNDDDGKNLFAANASGVIISLLENATAVANIAYDEPSPYGEEPTGFAVRVPELPAVMRTIKIIDYADDNGVVSPTERIVPAPFAVKIILRPHNITREKARVNPYENSPNDAAEN